MNKIIENIEKEIQKELNKIKQIKKIKKFNKRNKNLLYQNNKLTELGAFIIFYETYAFSEALIKGK